MERPYRAGSCRREGGPLLLEWWSRWPSACAGAGELCAVVCEAVDDRPELLPGRLVGHTVVLVEALPRAVDEGEWPNHGRIFR